MSEPIIVSVLMTAFNRQQFIAEAIESVVASTYQHWELIVVDDCSTDLTADIAQAYANEDHRIKVLTNEINLGDYVNRNRAAFYAKGKYLKYVDSDDTIYPYSLERMVEVMEYFPSAGVGLNDVFSIQVNQMPRLLNARDSYYHHYFQRPIFFASPGLAIFRKSIFNAVGGFPEKRMIGDFEMWHKIVLATPLVLIPGELYRIRKHAGQEVTEQNKYALEYEKIKLHYLFSSGSPLSKKEALEIVQRRQQTVLKIFLRKLAFLKLAEALVRLRVFIFYRQHINKLKIGAAFAKACER